jgi:hypothetical protein
MSLPPAYWLRVSQPSKPPPVLVSFGMEIHSNYRSFPRKRIQSDDSTFPKVCRVDSRFRGNDRRFESRPIPNDTNTPWPSWLRSSKYCGL